jgi:regulatory protein|tara:strand:+ start:1056 stop:1511 length:456 start_codon:yes stop_codon:yes gene_type:complete
MMPDDQFNIIYNKSLDLLSRREHSRKEIKEKLLLRYENTEQINVVLEKLVSNNLINDSRFAEAYVLNRKRKGFGPKKIIFELISKGVKESIANEVVEIEGGWIEAARSAFKKKYKDDQNIETKEQLKQKTFLQNRGFGFKEIESVFTNDML